MTDNGKSPRETGGRKRSVSERGEGIFGGADQGNREVMLRLLEDGIAQAHRKIVSEGRGRPRIPRARLETDRSPDWSKRSGVNYMRQSASTVPTASGSNGEEWLPARVLTSNNE